MKRYYLSSVKEDICKYFVEKGARFSFKDIYYMKDIYYEQLMDYPLPRSIMSPSNALKVEQQIYKLREELEEVDR